MTVSTAGRDKKQQHRKKTNMHDDEFLTEMPFERRRDDHSQAFLVVLREQAARQRGELGFMATQARVERRSSILGRFREFLAGR